MIEKLQNLSYDKITSDPKFTQILLSKWVIDIPRPVSKLFLNFLDTFNMSILISIINRYIDFSPISNTGAKANFKQALIREGRIKKYLTKKIDLRRLRIYNFDYKFIAKKLAKE